MGNKFDDFFNHRKNLIYLYNSGDLSKDEYIEANYNYIHSMNVQPFKRIDHMKKGIFNYQYYNVIAKYFQKKAHDSKAGDYRERMLENADLFYERKDYTTLKILEYLDFIGVEAYYVKVRSSKLRGRLFEIVFDEYGDVVLHSISESIRSRLEQEHVFYPQVRRSIVDSYINQCF